jgi:hypothetical protein
MKALANLAMSNHNVNFVIGEFGAIDIVIHILQTAHGTSTQAEDETLIKKAG